MFNALKDKLKKWVSKNEEKEVVDEIPRKKPAKKKTERKTFKKEPKETTTKKTKEKVEKKTNIERKPFFSNLKKETDREKPKRKTFTIFSKELTPERFDELFQELQTILLQNNVAYETVEAIESSLKESLVGKSLKEVDLTAELKSSILKLLINPPNFLEEIKSSESKPFIILFAGINGSGKTTTIAKVAHYLQQNKLSICLAAADTFRAAAIQQIEEHGEKLKVPVIKKDYGADPASVGFDAVKYATKNKIDVVLIDTAGRMQNRDSLMKELEKIERVTKPNMKIFLGESITGNDATIQAKTFNDSISLTGIILSKADVDKKGGTAISVSHITNKPILFLGTGQQYKDLEIFDKEKLIKKLGL